MTGTLETVDQMPLALDELYEQHHRMVFSTAYRITGNAADAEDVLHTVFLRLLRQSRDIVSPESYLRRSASNAALDIVRGRRETVLPDPDGISVAPHNPENADLAAHLRRALAGLPERSAEMFTLRYFEGLSNQEIARMTGVSHLLVAVTLHRTRKKLQKELALWRVR